MKVAFRVMAGVALGVLVTIPACIAAIISGGAGHGDYLFARMLFPYSLLLTRLAGDTLTIPLIVLAVAQFPLYGSLIGWAIGRMATGYIVVGCIVLAHAAAAAACFSGFLPNFS